MGEGTYDFQWPVSSTDCEPLWVRTTSRLFLWSQHGAWHLAYNRWCSKCSLEG